RSAASASRRRARSRNTCPSSVGTTPFEVRRKTGYPSRRSSSATLLVAADCVMPITSAAFEKEPKRPTATACFRRASIWYSPRKSLRAGHPPPRDCQSVLIGGVNALHLTQKGGPFALAEGIVAGVHHGTRVVDGLLVRQGQPGT